MFVQQSCKNKKKMSIVHPARLCPSQNCSISIAKFLEQEIELSLGVSIELFSYCICTTWYAIKIKTAFSVAQNIPKGSVVSNK